MDESYLAWLRLIPGVDAELARRIVERYPDPELLKAATPADLSSIPGIDEELAARVTELVKTATRSDEAWYKDEPSLYLCPECGSFVGKGAGACPFCGVVFEGGEEAAEEAAPPPVEDLLRADRGNAKICTKCGAFIAPGETACAMCGTRYPAEELAELPAVDTRPVQEAELYLCPQCGAFLAEGAESCAICGRPVAAEERVPGLAGKGVGKDFLARWKKAAEEETVPEEVLPPSLNEELTRQDGILAEAPENERAWVRKGRILIELGRAAEAIECFDRAALLNPARDETYRLEVTAALGPEDRSRLPERWGGERPRAPEAPAPPAEAEEAPAEAVEGAAAAEAVPEEGVLPAEVAAASGEVAEIERALTYYDRLLAADASLRAAWMTRAELLQRLGRTDEARAAVRRAAEAEAAELETGRAGLAGLETRAPGRGRVRRPVTPTGRTNGRVNGLTNGMRGRTNGLTNGLRGRTNGLVNGTAVKTGLGYSAGRVNGIINGLMTGRTNGLVNGDGFTNGRRGGRPRRIVSPDQAPSRFITAAAVLLLIVAVPLLASLLTATPPPEGIRIDGSFQDWTGVAPVYYNDPAHRTANPDVNVVDYKMSVDGTSLDVYAHLQGTAFRGAGGGADTLIALLDTDNNTATGYDAGSLGADVAVQITGWNGTIRDTSLLKFSSTANRTDWSGFASEDGTVTAASRGSDVEFSVGLQYPRETRVLLTALDGPGRQDIADAVVMPGSPALSVRESTVAPDVISTTSGVGILRIDLSAQGGAVPVSNVQVSARGTLPDGGATVTLYRDANRDGLVDPGDTDLGTTTIAQDRASFPVHFTIPANSTYTFLVAADFAGLPRAETFGLALENLTASAVASLASRALGLSYLTAPPASPVVDGAFADWAAVPTSPDPVGDVVNPENASFFENTNVDLTQVASSLAANASFYLRVDGTMLGGVDAPNLMARWYPSNNTTGQGPVGEPPKRYGVDSAIAYVDGDNSSATGLRVASGATTYGLDWALVVMGRHGEVISSGLYAYDPSVNVSWRFVQAVPAAVDASRLEVSAPDSVLNLAAGYRTLYYASDWRQSFDFAVPTPPGRSAPFPGTRNPAGTGVVINEISPQPNPEWLEVANPTSNPISLTGWTIQRQKGTKWDVIYTYGAVTLGAWGSGSQYLAVDPAANSFPNGQTTVRLVDAGGNEVDQTTYRGTSSGSTWARFKDPFTGKPMDSDNDAADFYVSVAPSKGAANDRHRPTIVVAKTANKATVAPGETITYTVYYNNTDTGRANYVWINDTLPQYVTYVGASVAPLGSAGQTYFWRFTNVNPSTSNSFTVTVFVTASAPNAASLVNKAVLEYTDQLNAKLTGSTAWRNVTVWRPVIKVVKIADRTTALPGDAILYTIYYNNTGFAAAGHVWINDTLPQDVTFLSSSVPPTSFTGQTYRWHFTNVGVGAHSFTISVRVNLNATSLQLVNWVFLNYTTPGGYPLEGSSASWTVTIPEFSDFALVAVVPFVVFAARRLWRRRDA